MHDFFTKTERKVDYVLNTTRLLLQDGFGGSEYGSAAIATSYRKRVSSTCSPNPDAIIVRIAWLGVGKKLSLMTLIHD